MKKGKLFVISGPSGTGKGTICSGILKKIDDVELSVSMTTREPRQGEIDKKNYYFVTEEKFEEIRLSDGFLESADVYGHHYGTPKENVLKQLERGINVILEIDTQGALNVKKSYPEAVLIFILPPSLQELKRRIKKRATDSDEAISKRMKEALKEISCIDKYNYFVVNDDLTFAIERVESIIDSEKSRVDNQITEYIKKYEEESK